MSTSTYDPADSAASRSLIDPEPASEATHRVKLAVKVGRAKNPSYVVECRCGWSTALLASPTLANEAYAEHKKAAQ